MLPTPPKNEAICCKICVAGSVAIFLSYSFVRIHSLSSPKSLTNQYPKVKLPEILGIWARKVEVMRLFTTPVWERSRGTPRQQFHSLLKGSCCALTWQQGGCNEWHWNIKADGIEIRGQTDKSWEISPKMNQNDKQGASAICVFTLWVCRLRQASKIGLSQTQGLYLNVNLTSFTQKKRMLENVESAAHRPSHKSPRPKALSRMLPLAGPSPLKSKFPISHVSLTFHLLTLPAVKYSPRPYPAVLLTTRTDVAATSVSPHDRPLMQPVTSPGELPFSVRLRFSKAKVKLPPGQFGTEASKQK